MKKRTDDKKALDTKTTETKETDEAVTLYSKLARKDSERDIALPEEIEDKALSLAEKWDTSALSDMQSAIVNLFPGDLGNYIVNKVMIARIAPEVFLALLKILVTEEIMRTPPNEPIKVGETVVKFYILLSIGLDGKGRIDHIELAGASKETEELEKLGKGLF